MIKLMYQSTQNAFKLLENLLVWARSQSGKIEFNPSFINIRNLVDENIELLNPIAIEKNIRLQSDVSDDYYINTDKDLINMVIRNLLSNAVKFTHEKGKVTLTSALFEGDYHIENIKISVNDTGIGMAQENLNKLFRIEKNYKSFGTKDETGTGLGLILCKEFIEKCNGKIWVESEEGKGSVFYFSLPNENASIEKIDHKNVVPDTK